MRKRMGFRTGLLWLMGVALLASVCTAGLALLDIHMSTAVTVALGMSPIWWRRRCVGRRSTAPDFGARKSCSLRPL